MFLTYKKGTKMDGSAPTLLYGYGGFNISLTPSFSIQRSVLLEYGGIYAEANIRGGGEFGKKWHKAGTLDQKQNVFNDFQAAAEYLIAQGYTSKDKLAIEGRSNGGLLVGNALVQRPEREQVQCERQRVVLRADEIVVHCQANQVRENRIVYEIRAYARAARCDHLGDRRGLERGLVDVEIGEFPKGGGDRFVVLQELVLRLFHGGVNQSNEFLRVEATVVTRRRRILG